MIRSEQRGRQKPTAHGNARTVAGVCRGTGELPEDKEVAAFWVGYFEEISNFNSFGPDSVIVADKSLLSLNFAGM